jgi:hypothetical protein
LSEELFAAADAGLGLSEGLPPNATWALAQLIKDDDDENGYCLNDLLDPDNTSEVNALIQERIQATESAFFSKVDTSDCNSPTSEAAEKIIELAHNKSQPPYLRKQLQDELDKAFNETSPNLKPIAHDHDGSPLYSTSDLAETLGVSEVEVLEKAEEMGALDMDDLVFYRVENPNDMTIH